jgi:hypothetical protein
MLAYPVQQYLAQRGTIAKLHRANAQAQQQVDTLQQQSAQWNDKAYVEREARSRLHYVMPGETEFSLVGGAPASAGPTVTATPTPTAGTWYARMWDTVQGADHPPPPSAASTPLVAPPKDASPAPIVPSAAAGAR